MRRRASSLAALAWLLGSISYGACSHQARLDQIEEGLVGEAGSGSGSVGSGSSDSGGSSSGGSGGTDAAGGSTGEGGSCDGVLCDGTCRSDTDDNPDACGEDCTVCPNAPDNGERTCESGSCGVVCNEDYHLESGTCRFRKGCSALAEACGGDDCCALDDIVAAAGQSLTFRRGYDASNSEPDGLIGWQSGNSTPVTLSAFQLDRYEVTVSRFRAFVESYDSWRTANPRGGTGAHPAHPTSGWQDPDVEDAFPDGWTNASYPDAEGPGGLLPVVPDDASELTRRLGLCASTTYTEEPSASDSRPVTCINYFEAMLFCIWDGGRLPTEAEWNLAAAGGNEQRAYPWSDPPDALDITPQEAVYDKNDGELPLPVGSKPAGVGRYGSHDLAGNVWEWVRDTRPVANADSLSYYPPGPEPLGLDSDRDQNETRILRGGSFKAAAGNTSGVGSETFMLRTAHRQIREGYLRLDDVGFRCARPAGGS